jgi:glycosyltransferase involved in cell wall biosynthesis
VLAVPESLEIILVDDGSSDSTWASMQRWAEHDRVQALRHESPRGKGAAVRTALTKARGKVILVQDADMEYDIGDYPRLLDPIRNGRAHVVYGTRVFASHTAHSYWYVMGNKGVTTAANLAAAVSLHFLYYNFARPHQSLRNPYPRTPAMAVGISDHVWKIEEIVALLDLNNQEQVVSTRRDTALESEPPPPGSVSLISANSSLRSKKATFLSPVMKRSETYASR